MARPTLKSVHNWIGLGSAVFLTALLATGILLNHPARLVPGADREVFCLAADPAKPGRLYRGTASSLDLSRDGGETWEEVPMAYPPLEAVSISFQPGRPEVMAVLQRWHGPIVSGDGGTVWEALPPPFDPLAAGVEFKSLSFDREGTLYAHTSHGTVAHGADGWRAVDFDLSRRNWLRVVRALHNGHFFGSWFVKVYDAAAAALFLLIVTGVVLWRMKSS